MRYKLLGFAVVLLIATPSAVSPQKMSPIIVKTGKPVPSVVRSGEPFRVTYQVKHTDAVLILEEKMRLTSLVLVADNEGKLKLENSVTGSVEVIDLVVGEKFRDGSEELGFVNVQDFTYTFMIISEQKGNNYKIPSFNFVWVKKSAGTTVAKTKEKEELREFPTKEVGISYISSIVKPPPINIRDATEFDAFETLAGRALMLAYGVIGLASLLALFVVARFSQQPKVKEEDKNKDNAEETSDDTVADAVTPVLSPWKARKKFLRELKALEAEVRSVSKDDEAARPFMGKLYSLARSLMVAELSGGTIKIFGSDSPKQLYKRLLDFNAKQKKQLGRKYGVILELARRSEGYYESVESDSCSLDPLKEINELKCAVEDIGFWRMAHSLVNKLILRK